MVVSRYTWSESWPGEVEDHYQCMMGDIRVGTVIKIERYEGDHWRWYAGWPSGLTGSAPTLREASEGLEAAFEAMEQRIAERGMTFADMGMTPRQHKGG